MNRRLTLFFTRGVSLKTWESIGALDREIALYRRLRALGWSVSFVTYGNGDELALAGDMDAIDVCANYGHLGSTEYEARLFTIHAERLSQSDIIKTNQSYGADIAFAAAQMFRKPLVARCGYMWSLNAEREFGAESEQRAEALRIENRVFAVADRILVTTESMREDVARRIPDAAQRVRVVPNYVDTDLFRDYGVDRDPDLVVYVGRIAPEKNLRALLRAIERSSLRLVIIGNGPLRDELEREFRGLADRVAWVGNARNSELPTILNRSGMFVLPSLYEGHPKSLIEAMACGAPVIGCDSPGIREVVEHCVNGLLCDRSAEGIRGAIEELRSNAELRRNLGRAGAAFVRERFSLERIAALESSVLSEIVG